MLPPFHIRNLQPSSLPKASPDTLVRITAPCYDETISSHPTATLKYFDEDDGDVITLGSSKELTEKLEEPVPPGLPTDLWHGIKPPDNHVFEIDDQHDVRKLWQDIQDAKDGTQNQGDTAKWSEEMKDRLAIFYEKRRADIWTPLAEEVGVTWQSVDAMHWAMGKEKMARKAYELNSHPGQSASSQAITQTKPNFILKTTGTQKFEDHRVQHSNATRSPQVQFLRDPPQQVQATAGLATIPKVSNVDWNHSTSSIVENNGEANLTAEGKRRTQAAGDKLGPKTTAVDSHQNRGASYKKSTSAFLPSPSDSPSLAFDGPGLTSEGKRQAQVAGDKLRSRTNPVRHSRPSRMEASEHGIIKNRWSSYGGTRATRFDERQDAHDDARNTSDITMDGVPKHDQSSLLEVFEAEMAKKIAATDREEASGFESPADQIPRPGMAMHVAPSGELQGQPLPQGSQALLGLINERLHELAAGDTALSQDFSTAIDHGIRTASAAVNGLSACVQNIARGLQEVSSVSRQAADTTRNADSQVINAAFLGVQSLTEGFTAALGRETDATRPENISVPRSGPEELENCSSSHPLDILHDKNAEENAAASGQSIQSLLNGSNEISESACCADHAAEPRYLSEGPAGPLRETKSQLGSGSAMIKEPQFHKPGQSPLPSRLGYVDYLRRSQSSKILGEQYNTQRASSSPLDTHFPTLAQFEGENSGAATTFPTLPSMKPLIPQRASCHSMYGTKAREPGPVDWSLPSMSSPKIAEASRFHNAVPGRHEHFEQRNEHESTPLSRHSSAARLAGPFDPMDAEPSARPHLTEGLRRNATISSTDVRHAARRRRPYSEFFDGSGRVPWSTFTQDVSRERRGLYSDGRGRPPGAKHEPSKRLSRPEAPSRRSPPATAGYEVQHHDDFTVGKIHDCVSRLRDLGFGGKDDDPTGRLLIYAQAADGVLVDAIDLIDEEQRAWQRL